MRVTCQRCEGPNTGSLFCDECKPKMKHCPKCNKWVEPTQKLHNKICSDCRTVLDLPIQYQNMQKYHDPDIRACIKCEREEIGVCEHDQCMACGCEHYCFLD